MSQLWSYLLRWSSVCAQHCALFVTSAVTGTMLLVTSVYCVYRSGAFLFFCKCASVFATCFFISHVLRIKNDVCPPLFETPSSLLIVVWRSFYKISPLSPCNIHITRMSVSLCLEKFTVLKRVLVVCIDQSAYTQTIIALCQMDPCRAVNSNTGRALSFVVHRVLSQKTL